MAVAQVRIALALAVSILLHIGFVAGIAIEAPERALPIRLAPLTAQLERVAVMPVPAALPQRTPASAELAEPQPLHARGQPLPEAASPPEKRVEYDTPRATAAADGMPDPVAALPHSAEPAYYSARELDVYPALRTPLRFENPARAAHGQAAGSVLVMLLLNDTGSVDEVSVVAAEPSGYFEDTVRAVFAAARFFPAQKNGRAVKSRVLIKVDFASGAAEGAPR